MRCHSLSPSRGGGGSSTEWPEAGGPGAAPGAWRAGEQQEREAAEGVQVGPGTKREESARRGFRGQCAER